MTVISMVLCFGHEWHPKSGKGKNQEFWTSIGYPQSAKVYLMILGDVNRGERSHDFLWYWILFDTSSVSCLPVGLS